MPSPAYKPPLTTAQLLERVGELEAQLAEQADAGEKRVRELEGQIARLKSELDVANGEGCNLHTHVPHGKEAEELRVGVEKLVAYRKKVSSKHLRRLLDSVNARDSLAHVRAQELSDSYAEALRELASYVGSGGHNAPDPINAKEFVAKVRDGIDQWCSFQDKEEMQRAKARHSDATVELEKAREEIACLKSAPVVLAAAQELLTATCNAGNIEWLDVPGEPEFWVSTPCHPDGHAAHASSLADAYAKLKGGG